MPYFERTKKFSNLLFGMWGIFLILSITGFFNNLTKDIRDSIFTVVCFVLSLFLLVMAIALRYIAIDAKEEFTNIAEQMRDLRDK